MENIKVPVEKKRFFDVNLKPFLNKSNGQWSVNLPKKRLEECKEKPVTEEGIKFRIWKW